MLSKGESLMIINGIEIYTITNPAYEQYIKEAKSEKNIPRDVLEIKLTAMALNAHEKNRVLREKYLYRFGDFTMVINESTKRIEVIGWRFDDHHSKGIGSISQKKLRDTYKLFGLNNKGINFKVKE